jgi:hypothetical protein
MLLECFGVSIVANINSNNIKSGQVAQAQKRAKLNLKTIVYKIFELT